MSDTSTPTNTPADPEPIIPAPVTVPAPAAAEDTEAVEPVVPTPPVTGSVPPAQPTADERESFFRRVEDKVEDVLHGAEDEFETIEGKADPVIKTVTTDVDDAAKVADLDPALAPEATVVETLATDVEGGAEDVAEVLPPRVGGVTVDSAVTQGNRVTTTTALDPENPYSLLVSRIKNHASLVTPIISALRAKADELEAELNKLGVGL
jgi:hypothetical protein